MRKKASFILFIIIEIALLPVTMGGYSWLACKLLRANRRTGVSTTAYSPLGTRWALHEMGSRPDDATRRIVKALSNGSLLAWNVTLAPTLLAMRVSGHTPRRFRYPTARDSGMKSFLTHRTAFFDRALAEQLDHVDQFVILGAGWDTRAHNLPADSRVRVYEVDKPEIQKMKCRALRETGIDLSRVTFVSADFNTEPWIDTLTRGGFDPALSAFFLWEGVSYYLEPEAVAATLNTVANLCAPGSAIAFDYFGEAALGGEGRATLRYGAKILERIGEPWRFAISTASPAREHLSNFLADHGLVLTRYEAIGGPDENKIFGGLALAVNRGDAG